VKTTGVGREERGYHPGKKAKGHKRHILMATEGLVMRSKAHVANVFDRETGPRGYYTSGQGRRSRISRTWSWTPDTTARGRAKPRAEKMLGLTVAVVRP
jgi:putative transposase